jgi:hypothetical protein
VQQTQDTKVSIRYLIKEDCPEILNLAKEPVQSVLPDKEYEEEKILKLCDAALINEDITGIVLIVEGKLKGFILGILTEHYFHSSKMAYCMAIFVSQDSRKYGLEMVRAFEAWARYKKAESLHIATYTNLSPKSLGKLYQKLGYSVKEVIYQKEI